MSAGTDYLLFVSPETSSKLGIALTSLWNQLRTWSVCMGKKSKVTIGSWLEGNLRGENRSCSEFTGKREEQSTDSQVKQQGK